MKLLIVQPTYYRDDDQKILYKTRGRTLQGLTLPYLAALTPTQWLVNLVDEQIEEINFSIAVDLVAITTWSVTARRAYDIADTFRSRGVTVIMGGPHIFFHADEALAHCDAVGIGEGEDIWTEMLADAAGQRLKTVYRAPRQHPLTDLPIPRYDKMARRLQPLTNIMHLVQRLLNTYTVQTSRGCPFRCDFCSERFFVGDRYRYRPVTEVVQEIQTISAKNVFFADSMFAGKKSHTVELMESLIPLNIRWSTLWSTYLCEDENFLDLAKRSGLLHVNMGMESINQASLLSMNKRQNHVDHYGQLLANLRQRGISYSLNFVFGLDDETPEVFSATLDFLYNHRVPVAYFYILSPHKGTPLYDKMLAQGRIRFTESAIRRTPGIQCEIIPPYGTPEEMEGNVRAMYQQFYRWSSMLRRLPPPTNKANLASWTLNMQQRQMARIDRAAQNHNWI